MEQAVKGLKEYMAQILLTLREFTAQKNNNNNLAIRKGGNAQFCSQTRSMKWWNVVVKGR